MPFALDHRLALVLYVVLLLAAAAAIVIAWLRLLPPEPEPFAISNESMGRDDGDAFAVFLLVNITLSLLLRTPGVNTAALSVALTKWLTPEWADHVVRVGFIWFGFIAGLASVYSVIRKNPLRWPLVAGGVLTLALWLSGPYLVGAIRGAQ